MSLVNTLLVDLASSIVSFTSNNGVNDIESIAYDNNTKNITFNSVSGAILSGADFTVLMNQVLIFQTLITNNYSPGTAYYQPFDSYVAEEKYDTGIFGQTLTCSEEGQNNLMDFQATPSNDKVLKAERTDALTIPFSEWIMVIASLAHYQQSVRVLFGI